MTQRIHKHPNFRNRFAEAPEKLEIATVGMEPGLYFLTIPGVPGRRAITHKFNISR